MDPFARKILIYPRAEDGLQAKFSMPWCAALAFLDGDPAIETFRDERVRRADVEELARRVRVIDESVGSESVDVVFEDGVKDTETVTLPLGHPKRPLSRDQHLRKVRTCIEPRLGSERAESVIDAFERLEEMADVRDLLARVRVK
jgi:2-methylcitrate dehydratase PrpD